MKNLDTLYTDATCYESAMRYPTDAKLLWECIEEVYPMMCEASRELGIHTANAVQLARRIAMAELSQAA